MTVQELQEIMSQRFETQDKMISQRFEAIDQRFEGLGNAKTALKRAWIAWQLNSIKCWNLSRFSVGSVSLPYVFGSMRRGLLQLLSSLPPSSRVFCSNQQTRKG